MAPGSSFLNHVAEMADHLQQVRDDVANHVPPEPVEQPEPNYGGHQPLPGAWKHRLPPHLTAGEPRSDLCWGERAVLCSGIIVPHGPGRYPHRCRICAWVREQRPPLRPARAAGRFFSRLGMAIGWLCSRFWRRVEREPTSTPTAAEVLAFVRHEPASGPPTPRPAPYFKPLPDEIEVLESFER